MDVHLISSPYYLGHRDVGMGAGPSRLVEPAAASLRSDGHDVTVRIVDFSEAAIDEVGACFAVNRLQSEATRVAVGSAAFPILLTGNCNGCLAAVAGLGLPSLGIVWFDAHGDFNSPDSSGSGFFDGMALHIATGGSWRKLAASIPGFRPVSGRDVVLIGVRDLDEEEQVLIESAGLAVVDADAMRRETVRAAVPALDAVAGRTHDVYVHVDVDVLDPAVAPVNEYQPEGGLALAELLEALELIGERFTVRAATLACYNPERDPEGRGREAAVTVVRALADVGWTG